MTNPIAVSNEEDECLKQLEAIKDDFMKSVSVSDTSLNAITDSQGIIICVYTHCTCDKILDAVVSWVCV